MKKPTEGVVVEQVNQLGARGVPPALRRALMITIAVLGAFAVVGPLAPIVANALESSVASVSGVVYKDKNGNGAQDKGEPGLAGVSVSDGAKIVATDDSGRYTIDIDLDRRIADVVFITQPAGYAVPVDKFMTPQFYHGFGELTDGAQAQADFGLLPDPKSNGSNFTFANLADVHVNVNLADQLKEINATAQDLAFVQVSGDLTNNASAAEFNKYLTATAASALPVWPAVGNHEIRPGATYAAQINNYRSFVGPEWYSFDYGDRHFLVLENNGGAPFEEQRAWAEQDLATHAQGKHVVVITHQPMNVPFGALAPYDSYADLLEQYDTELILVGHEHSNDIDKEWVKGARHVQTNSSESTIDDSPRGFRYVHMDGDGFTNPFRMYGVEQSLTITSPAPGSEVSAQGLTEIQVNAYQTADEVQKVRYRLDGDKKWYTMEKPVTSRGLRRIPSTPVVPLVSTRSRSRLRPMAVPPGRSRPRSR